MAAAMKASAMSARALFKKGAPAKKGTQPTKKKFSFGGGGKPQVNKASVSQQKFGRELWLPNTEPPEWLDGSLPGDRGFDPLGLAKPAEFIQMSTDALDQNAAVNKAGSAEGRFKSLPATVSETSLQPYSEVFDLSRFRECELIHGRWCMLATLGIIVAELSTGVSWVDAGKVELEKSSYLGFELPFTITQLCYIEAILMGIIEVYRSKELDLEKRLYPGGNFDPLGFATEPDQAFRLKEAEIKHSRLAMVAMLGFAVQAGFSGSTSPISNLGFLN